ncbi:Non-hem dioxygenase N-terminal domain - like 6 [Theobroma cacao]|nr:Non-hem dioxygenase N-terminal domain - like 6 [Theobroma cacao]
MAATMNGENQYDRTEEVKRFDESKIGVKGLVDSGLTSVPRFFIHPPETLSDLKPKTKPESVVIPAIDLSGPRSTVVEQVASASRSFGFFQIVNHGIPVQVLDRTIGSIRAFHEQPTDVKARFYRRDTGTGVSFISNIDLFHSKAASWRDTLQIKLGPTLAELEEIPEILSNDEYTSVEHRVLANPSHEPRVSVAVFFNASARDALYGPFPELTSAGKPALYRQFTYNDYMRRFFTKELDGKTLTNYYRL